MLEGCEHSKAVWAHSCGSLDIYRHEPFIGACLAFFFGVSKYEIALIEPHIVGPEHIGTHEPVNPEVQEGRHHEQDHWNLPQIFSVLLVLLI